MITGIKMIAVQMGTKVIFCIFKKTMDFANGLIQILERKNVKNSLKLFLARITANLRLGFTEMRKTAGRGEVKKKTGAY